jgi:hypothetical protein
MNAPELPDNQLDGLFRQSADAFAPPFDPAHWVDMRGRLVAFERKRWLARLLGRALPLLFLAILPGEGWQPSRVPSAGLSKPEKSAIIADKSLKDNLLTAPVVSANPSSAAVARGFTKNRPVDQPMETPAGVQTKQAKKSATHEYIDANLARNAVRSVGKSDRETFANLMRDKPVAEPVRRSVSVSKTVDNESITVDLFPENTRPIRSPKLPEPNPMPVADALPDEATNPVFVINLLASKPFRPATPILLRRELLLPPDTATAPQRETVASAPSRARTFSLQMVVSPDLSMIGLKRFDAPGTNTGLLLNYHPANRWSVQTGVFYSSKRYRAIAADYEWPSVWRNAVRPSGVQATCTLIDIPLNVRYDLAVRSAGRGSARWFVGGGITNYVMLREVYDYDFADPADPRIRVWTFDSQTTNQPTEKQFLFGTANLSAGYERSFTRRWSFQAEPFLKVPLQRLGFFKVNLISTGAFFSLRYAL